MGRKGDLRSQRRHIDAEAWHVFLTAVREGTPLAEAAAKTGFTLSGFYSARSRNALLRLAWAQAMELSGNDQRDRLVAERAGEASGAKVAIAANNRRRVQLRRCRRVEFTPRRQGLFLLHFGRTADFEAAAVAAGVHPDTVYKHRQRHPEFSAAIEQELGQAFIRLEAEALRQRLAVQQRLKEGFAAGDVPAETAMEFERVLKLLQRWDRKHGQPGVRGPAPGRMKRWTFEQAIEALDRKLRAVNIPILGEDGAPAPGFEAPEPGEAEEGRPGEAPEDGEREADQ